MAIGGSGWSSASARARRGRVEDALAEAELVERVADVLADRVVERLAPYLGARGVPPEGLVDAKSCVWLAALAGGSTSTQACWAPFGSATGQGRGWGFIPRTCATI